MKRAFLLTLLALLPFSPVWLKAAPDLAQTPLRQKAVEWIKTKAHYNPDDESFAKILSQIDKDIKDEKYFTVALGSDLVKSGKPQLVFGFAGELFVFELSGARAKKLGLGAFDADYATAGGKRLDKRKAKPAAKLEVPEIKNASRLNRNKKITGQVACETLRPGKRTYALRLSYQVGGSWTHQFYPLNKLPSKKKGTFRFSFKPLATGKDDRTFAGPVALFLDLCTLKQKAGSTEIRIYSNTVGLLVDVVGKGGKK
jgi:hypothetical protein